MSKLLNVTRDEVDVAWKAVRQTAGGPGIDGWKIPDIEADLDNRLHIIWKKIASGSYFPDPVLLVNIPKAKGGVRELGIPTVRDRIAQTVIKNRLEPILEEHFHASSYAYRPGKSAIDALAVARENCFRHEWVIDIDIKNFFDDIDHDFMMEMVEKYTNDKVVLLYTKRFLGVKGQTEDKEVKLRTKGTPQGGVISPLLSNLYLHEAFDKWMKEKFPDIKFERYADDIIVHCVSERQAYFLKNRIEGRLNLFKLTLNRDKTRIVYTGNNNTHDKRGHKLSRKFTFLGYDFKPRNWKGKIVFTPGIGASALKNIRKKIKDKWQLKRSIGYSLEWIAEKANPKIRGWINYYGHYRRSELYKLGYMIDTYLAMFLKRKFKLINTWNKAWKDLAKRKKESPYLFCHWYMISLSKR